jgi:SAM-dependent methyltransferase
MDTREIGKILGEKFDGVAGDGALALAELHLAPDAAILDVGTGKGYFAIFLASQGYRVVTGEPSTDKSHYAGQAWALNAEKAGVRDRIQFEHFDAAKMPFAPEAFDAVFFYGVLHHVPEAQRGDVLREAFRVAKKDGVVVLFEPRPELLQRLWKDDPGHPHAAEPSKHLPGADIHGQRIEGALMQIFIYRREAAKAR